MRFGIERPLSEPIGKGAAVSSTYAWAVVMMLWPVAVLNYLDRQMLATMGATYSPRLMSKVAWSSARTSSRPRR